nr:immunoglobulin light chain junction region [Macaca mulatta]MOV84687.1 immunoglobulin light chain junction region [Macaca mulatta]
CYQYSSGYSF